MESNLMELSASFHSEQKYRRSCTDYEPEVTRKPLEMSLKNHWAWKAY